MIPCYVTGRGMHATAATWDFKVAVILALERSGVGYDTRFWYYQAQYPDLSAEALARQVCDPIEYYDRDWPAWRDGQPEMDPTERVTRFFLSRDRAFRDQAQCAIFGLDEAGFGSGVNAMRFLQAGKPVLGFLRVGASDAVNPGNVLQLALEYPDQVALRTDAQVEEIPEQVIAWLQAGLPAP